jgi:multidrug transporter EmrE-like cation transporter
MTVVNVLCMTLSEIFGNFNVQKFAQTNRRGDLLFGLLGYLGVIFFLWRSFGHGNMLWVTTMWEGMIIVFGSAFAYLYLGERFHHPIQYIGIILGFLAMCCVNYGDYLSKTGFSK